MSAQMPLIEEVGDPAARRTFDHYRTPEWMTLALLDRVDIGRRVLEPCVGDGAIESVLLKMAPRVVATNDLDPQWPADVHRDASQSEFWNFAGFPMVSSDPINAVVTNPPFNLADALAPLAFEYCEANRAVLALLLRLSWLEPAEARAPFLELHPPDVLIVLPRHDFRGNRSTDSVTSAWFVWTPWSMSVRGSLISVVTKTERDILMQEWSR